MQTAKGLTGLMLMMLLATIGCGDAATESASESPQLLESFDSELWLDQEWVGDLDGMAERGVVRVLVVYSLGQYFLDGATQRGASYEALIEFEKFLNQALFTFAAYNAGPARVAGLREEAARAGLDANQWFGNVEHIAAKRIGRETVQYVSNIGKYWVAYRLASRHLEMREDSTS